MLIKQDKVLFHMALDQFQVVDQGGVLIFFVNLVISCCIITIIWSIFCINIYNRPLFSFPAPESCVASRWTRCSSWYCSLGSEVVQQELAFGAASETATGAGVASQVAPRAGMELKRQNAAGHFVWPNFSAKVFRNPASMRVRWDLCGWRTRFHCALLFVFWKTRNTMCSRGQLTHS